MDFREKYEMRKRLESADGTILCFDDRHNGFMVKTEVEFEWLYEDHCTGRHKGDCGRIRLRSEVKKKLKASATCQMLGSLEELQDDYRKAYQKATGDKAPNNKGYMFECAVTQRIGKQVWTPDKIPFWKAPDVVIDGIGYQIKSDGSQFFTDTNLHNAMKEKGLI